MLVRRKLHIIGVVIEKASHFHLNNIQCVESGCDIYKEEVQNATSTIVTADGSCMPRFTDVTIKMAQKADKSNICAGFVNGWNPG